MKHDLSPDAVAERLGLLREVATLETIEETRTRLEAYRSPATPFAEAAGRRLAELRALCELTRYLHSRR
jgi:hypothetical protein